jgi:hypothetical protein
MIELAAHTDPTTAKSCLLCATELDFGDYLSAPDGVPEWEHCECDPDDGPCHCLLARCYDCDIVINVARLAQAGAAA